MEVLKKIIPEMFQFFKQNGDLADTNKTEIIIKTI